VEYRDAAMPGPVALLRGGTALWIEGTDGTLYASLLRT